MEVDAASVEATVGIRGVVYDERGHGMSSGLEIGAFAELWLVHPVRTLFKLGLSHIKAESETRKGREIRCCPRLFVGVMMGRDNFVMKVASLFASPAIDGPELLN